MKSNLKKLGARVTSDSPESTYLSLRNTHTEIHGHAATIEADIRTRNDFKDFSAVNEAVANGMSQPGEIEEFKKWYRTSLGTPSTPVHHGEYSAFKVTLSRKPMRALFTPKAPAAPE